MNVYIARIYFIAEKPSIKLKTFKLAFLSFSPNKYGHYELLYTKEIFFKKKTLLITFFYKFLSKKGLFLKLTCCACKVDLNWKST